MSLNIKGYRRTFSINCLGGDTPKPIRELTINGLFTAADPTATPPIVGTTATITDFEVDILSSASIQARQALSVAVDTSYDRPTLIGDDTSSALFNKYNTESKKYNLVIYTGNQNQVTIIDFKDIPRSFGLNLSSQTVYAVKIPEATELSLLSTSQVAALTTEQIETKTKAMVSLLTETDGEIRVSTVTAQVINNEPATQIKNELIGYIGITEEFREYDAVKGEFKYLIDASAFLI